MAGSCLMSLWYRRPQWRDTSEYTQQLIAEYESKSPTQIRTNAPTSIPSSLSLDKVLSSSTLSPMSLQDFYMYLKYIEKSSENLEFYLWYKNYEMNYPEDKRDSAFDELPESPTWSERRFSGISSIAEIVSIKGKVASRILHFPKPPTPEVDARRDSKLSELILRWSLISTRNCNADSVDDDAEKRGSALPLPLFNNITTRRENRAELDAAIETYLQPGAEKEIRIPEKLRLRTLQQLERSSDPRGLKPVADHVYGVMQGCSHPNFFRLGVATGTVQSTYAGVVAGITALVVGVALLLPHAFFPYVGAHSQLDVLFTAPLWWFGTTACLVASKGGCVILGLMSMRQTLPWETPECDGSTVASPSTISPPAGWCERMKLCISRLAILDKKVLRARDGNLRCLQRLILLQCHAYGALAAIVGVLSFIFLPIWKETVVLQG